MAGVARMMAEKICLILKMYIDGLLAASVLDGPPLIFSEVGFTCSICLWPDLTRVISNIHQATVFFGCHVVCLGGATRPRHLQMLALLAI